MQPTVQTDDRRQHVTIAVLTYQRTTDLTEVLPALRAEATSVPDDVSILVVDNDVAASARAVVEGLALPEVVYVNEARPGIAAARNRALDEVGTSGLLVFIDDDERPSADWLRSLLECYARESCTAVAGAVVPDLGLIDDPWIRAGGFFVRRRQATGSIVRAASTANLLLDLNAIDRLGGVRFDERFGATGGSDTLFTRTLIQRGGRIVWCDEAEVTDCIRPQRLTRGWVLQRHFRSGNSWSRSSVQLETTLRARAAIRLRLTAEGLARVVAGTMMTALGTVTRSLRRQARGSKMAARGSGMLLGAWGLVYIEYRRGAGERRFRRG